MTALIQTLHSHFGLVIVVNDGSEGSSASIFDETSRWAKLISIPQNRGKGAALKAGLELACRDFPGLRGVVFADADGQHTADDILRVAGEFCRQPDRAVLGSRSFEQADAPPRSRFGNWVSRSVTKWVLGFQLRDTQTGLRAVPANLLGAIQDLPSNRYDFETEMLLLFKHSGIPVDEVPIRTIYEKGNPTSHFRPIQDSGRILYLLIRFLLLSVVTALADNAVYLLAAPFVPRWALVLGRIAGMCLQYPLARRAVFMSVEPHRLLLPRYLMLVGALTTVTALLLWAGLEKIVIEAILFPFSFWLQRELVFRASRFRPTNWTTYYRSVPWTANLTRRYTSRRLLAALRLHPNPKVLVELGGANSCFVSPILEAFPKARYCAVDTNDYGLQMLRERFSTDRRVETRSISIQSLPSERIADVVISVGLIEHFSGEDLRQALDSHFRILEPGGLAIISFPTPTVLYSAVRAAAEMLRLWKFPDEVPLWKREVDEILAPYGEVIHEEILWPLVLTQQLMVVRANGISTCKDRTGALKAYSGLRF